MLVGLLYSGIYTSKSPPLLACSFHIFITCPWRYPSFYLLRFILRHLPFDWMVQGKFETRRRNYSAIWQEMERHLGGSSEGLKADDRQEERQWAVWHVSHKQHPWSS